MEKNYKICLWSTFLSYYCLWIRNKLIIAEPFFFSFQMRHGVAKTVWMQTGWSSVGSAVSYFLCFESRSCKLDYRHCKLAMEFNWLNFPLLSVKTNMYGLNIANIKKVHNVQSDKIISQNISYYIYIFFNNCFLQWTLCSHSKI